MVSKRSYKVTRQRGTKKPSQPAAIIVQQSVAGLPTGYVELLKDLKARIRAAQVKAALSVSRDLIALYWDIGRSIVERQRTEGWGKSVVERLAADLQREFPAVAGFSPANIWRMRAFYIAYADEAAKLAQLAREKRDTKLAQLARELDAGRLPQGPAEIPWFHNVVLVEKVQDPIQRFWYAQQTITHGWSRVVLLHQIESGAFGRSGKALTNFKATLPAPQSDLAAEVLKDPYNFDFLALGPGISERELETNLIDHLRDFLVELGKGFAFVGSQYHLEVAGQDYYLDLLFYHLHLRCYVVIDLKIEEFKPEFAGKMNFYLSTVDDLLRHSDDTPSIGLILCKERNHIVVEYALRDIGRPMGVAAYKLTHKLPAKLQTALPTPEQLVKELSKPDKRPDQRSKR
jgi:predicted nuclease of restriction endonuclease-like (RecB) superfamily